MRWILLLFTSVISKNISPTDLPLLWNRNPDKISWTVNTIYGRKIIKPVPIRLDPVCYRLKVGRLVFSSIPKSNSRTMKRMLCELILRQRGVPITPDLFDPPDASERPACVEGVGLRGGTLRGWKGPENRRIYIWRDPIDRFVSIYGATCDEKHECGVAGKSVHTAARAFYKYLKFGKLPKGASNLKHFRHHITPSSWFCRIGERPKLYTAVHYTQDSMKMAKRLRPMLKLTGKPPKTVNQVLRWLLKNNTNPRRRDPKVVEKYAEWKREILSNRTTMSYILATYYHDYRMAGVPLPKLPKE